MGERPPAAPQPPDPSIPAIEMSEAMRGAVNLVVDDHATRKLREEFQPAPAMPVGWLVTTMASWAILVVLLLFRPAIARVPEDRTFASPPELRAASLRFGLWLARHRMEAFTRSAARLPGYLGEAGVDDLAVTLESNNGGRYTLIARDSSVELRLTSEMSVDSFLGESLITLAASKAYQQAGTPGRTTAR